ncbi:MMPL family transporter [Nocardioides pocheonensis]|uniref:MMPL family transporter n=1 Tax=Nocardioides pocheonensis TaxID=661485 RepID=A0A3N0GXX4_9ACTN|nr:MMPL family transporter [Nocardioides pocheonensis]RNM16990.1 MMPL family transporter [Nocardioides pocheonensis]
MGREKVNPGPVVPGRRNIAASMARWSVRHRIVAVVGWVLFVALAVAVGASAGQQQMTEDEYAQGDSAKALQVLDQAGLASKASEMFLLTGPGAATGPAMHATVTDLVGRLQATGLVTAVTEPYANGLVSADGHSVLVQVTMKGDPMTAADRVQPLEDAAAATAKAHPGVRLDEFGDGSANQWFNDTIGKDFRRAEWTAVPLALGILLIAFGAFLAAVLPVGLALTSFLAANGLLALISHRMHVDSSTSSVMLLVGLAVGVDYCMFYLRREREERALGRTPESALMTAAATSGRSVLVSGLTVVAAMAGMYLSGMTLFNGFGTAAILVVLVAILGSVTVLPALLSLLGDRVDLGRVPGLARMRRPQGGSKAWAAILGRVLKRPGVSTTVATLFLLVLAAPAVGIHTEKLSLSKLLPADASIMQSYRRINTAFPGGPSPANVVVASRDLSSPALTAAVADFRARAASTGAAQGPIVPDAHPDAGILELYVPLAGSGSDKTSARALATLREDVIPATLGAVPGTKVYVAGNLAFSEDFNAHLEKAIVPVVAFVLVLAFVLMLVAFDSVTIAAVSVLLNVLSMAAAFGVMVAVFQHGWGAGLVGAHGVGAIESWIPLFSFVILFGLSMDYQVFVVSRIREAHDRGLPTRDAVAHGIEISAGVVTSAAAIMVGVFAVFGTLSMTTFKQLGVGLAVAILLDATVVRAVLLPSLLAALGDRTWWLPRRLRFLARGEEHEAAEAPTAPVEAPTGVGQPVP